MAEGQVKQALEKEVTCALCLDLFKEPKKLPCDHVYCRDCLGGLALRSLNAPISCPECRTLTQIPGNDVNNFPTAFQTNRLIEAFQQMQVRVETDSPNVAEMCQVHSTQPLAIYCETCKKQLCRDCVLMSKEHASHTYGFFAEVTPKYRKKVISELSLIKTQKSSISTALGEIAAAESNVADHAQRCQDDVERTFEEMISVLQTCKRAMKDEATAYYSSLSGVFDQQKERLKDIQGKIESVVTSVDTTLQDNDQSFLVRLESTFERISNLQKSFQAVSLDVDMPQLIGMQAVDIIDALPKCPTLYKLADAKTCFVDSLTTKLQVGRQMTFFLVLRDSSGKNSTGENAFDIGLQDLQGNIVKGTLGPLVRGNLTVFLTPERRGQHQLNVKVNGAHIKSSPFTVTVYMPPIHDHLSQAVASISGLGKPTSLVYLEAEDKVLATIKSEGRISKVDTQFHVIESELMSNSLPHIYEITYYAALKIVFITTGNDQVHKLSSDDRILKTVGRRGKNNAEFNHPNGLRVSKKCELYVCDSSNNRIQVFDLDLNFKRSFGKHGTGKRQFNFPSDVDFDTDSNVYVSDHNNHRIQVFTRNERHIRTITNLFSPVSLLMHNDKMYVTDWLNHKVVVMNLSGEIIATFGDGILRYPEGIAIDEAGFVYVTSHFSKIVVF